MIMKEINTVIEGEYKGSDIGGTFWGNLSIGEKSIDKKDVQDIKVVDIFVNKNDVAEHKFAYSIDINFKTGETSRIFVDKEIHDKIIEMFPNKKENYLNIFLKKGYKIVGYSSSVFANSGLAVGTIIHTILLQKELDVKQIVFHTCREVLSNCYIHSLSEGE